MKQPPKREYPRAARVAVQLQRELGDLIRTEIPDAAVQSVTVTKVDLSPDMRNARVYISRLGMPVDEALAILQKAAGRLRGRLGKTLRLRRIPELTFANDVMPDRADAMNRLIREARARDAAVDGNAADNGGSESGDNDNSPGSAQ